MIDYFYLKNVYWMLLKNGIVKHCLIRALNGHFLFSTRIALPCTTVHRLQIIPKRTNNRQARLSILTLTYNKFITILIGKYSWKFIMRIGTNNSKDDKNYEWFMLAVRFCTIIIEYTCTLNLHKNKTLKYTCISKKTSVCKFV